MTNYELRITNFYESIQNPGFGLLVECKR